MKYKKIIKNKNKRRGRNKCNLAIKVSSKSRCICKFKNSKA